jgi:alcohol dehydrogenase class IV
MIDHVMRFNLPAASREDGRARPRGRARQGAGGMSERDAAAALDRLAPGNEGRPRHPATLSALTSKRAVTGADVPALVEVAIHDTCHKTNPRPCTREDFERIFAAAI